MKNETIIKLKSLSTRYKDLSGFWGKHRDDQYKIINRAFIQSCQYKDHAAAHFLAYDTDLPYNANLYGSAVTGFTYACLSGSLEIVKMYIDTDTQQENKQNLFLDHQALKYACQENHLHLLKYFEEIKNDSLKIDYDEVITGLNLALNKDVVHFILFETDYEVDNRTYHIFKNIFKQKDMVELFDHHKIYIEKLKMKDVLEVKLNNDLHENKSRFKL